MALIRCTNCGHMISDKGIKCPNCGTPIIKVNSEIHTEICQEVSEVESSIDSTNKDDRERVVITNITPQEKENRYKRKYVVAAVCGILFIAVMAGFYLLQKPKSKASTPEKENKITYSAELVERAEQGDAEAQKDLGLCYGGGYGVTQDYNEAVQWLHKAAEQGNGEAQCNLGYCYQYGYGVSQDYNEAVQWWRKAAEQGNAKAQSCLGSCYENGNGVNKNFNEAVQWYRKAAEQGLTEAVQFLETLDP